MVHWSAPDTLDKRQRFTYRGYMVEVINEPAGWQVGIHPMRPDLPSLTNRQFAVEAGSKDEVLSVGCRRIDGLLSS
jgi:hypothetical protein